MSRRGGAVAESAQSRPPLAARVVTGLALAGMFLAGAVCLAASLLPYRVLAGRVASLTLSGGLHFFTPEFAAALQAKLAWTGGALAVLAAAGGAAFPRLARLAARLGADLGLVAREAWAALRREAREEKALLAGLAVLTAGGAVLRVLLMPEPIRHDEAATFYHFASRPLWAALSYYPQPNNHMLNTLLVHVSTALGGSGLWAIRLPALAAGVALVPAVYLAFAGLGSRRGGLVAAGLVAANWQLVLFSTNARGYILVALAFTLLIPLTRRLAVRPSPVEWGLWAVLAALGSWAVPTMLFPLAALCGFWLAQAARHREAGPLLPRLGRLGASLLAAGGLALALYSPAIIGSGWDSLVHNKFVQSKALDWGRLPAYLAEAAAYLFQDQPGWVVALEAAGALACLSLIPPRARAAGWLGWAALAGPLALLALHGRPPFPRVWTFELPVALGLAGAGLASLSAGALGRLGKGGRDAAAVAVAVALAAAVAAHWLPGREERLRAVDGSFQDAPAVAQLLQERVHPEDRVLARTPQRYPLIYHWRGGGNPFRLIPQRVEGCPPGRLWVVAGGKVPLEKALAGLSPPCRPEAPPPPVAKAGRARVYLLK